MRSILQSILIGFLLILVTSQVVYSQDEDLDFSDLEKVEQEEFGGDTSGEDTGEFDLDVDSQNASGEGDALDELDKELTELDGPAPTPAPGSDTVDLEKELQENLDDPGKVDGDQSLEEQIVEEPAPEVLPPLETPEEEQVVEEPAPEPVPEPAPETPTEQVAETPAPIEPSDEPNEKLESRLNRIYRKFMSSRTSDDEWLQIAGEKAQETYQVQPGDTLWDISITFFGNGHFWPKIWQLNDDITNPHIIRAGRMIKFTPGTLEDAPQMQVTEEDGQPVEGGEEAPPEQQLAEGETAEQAVAEGEVASADGAYPELPPPTFQSKPALKQLPPSIPFLVVEDEEEFDKDGFAIQSVEKQKINLGDASIYLSSYLSEEEPNALGEVKSMEAMGFQTATVGEFVYVEAPSARIGDIFTVIEIGDKVKYDGDKFGYGINYQGTIKITARVNDDDPIYKAQVLTSIDRIAVNSKLIKESIPKILISRQGRENTAKGVIVGGNFDGIRKVLGEGSIVYLNIGATQGLAVGDVMAITRNDRARNHKSLATRDTKLIGKLKVAKLTPTRATAVVVQSSETVVPGDVIGGYAPINASATADASAGMDEEIEEDFQAEPEPGFDELNESTADDLELE